jgi:hypothetical protein
MRIPSIHGLIRRRILVNFRVDPDVLQRHLPARFRPKLHDGYAVAGICLIRLERIRPRFAPALAGLASENAAHRVAVTWDDVGGAREGVFIFRRDTDSRLNQLAGGRLFPGEHKLASFDVVDHAGRIELAMRSRDGSVHVALHARSGVELPSSSIFASVGAASAFFEGGAVGYSLTHDAGRLDGLKLTTREWRVAALEVESVYSSIFADPARFPNGSADFDHALIMRDIAHEWHGMDDLYVLGADRGATSPV